MDSHYRFAMWQPLRFVTPLQAPDLTFAHLGRLAQQRHAWDFDDASDRGVRQCPSVMSVN